MANGAIEDDVDHEVRLVLELAQARCYGETARAYEKFKRFCYSNSHSEQEAGPGRSARENSEQQAGPSLPALKSDLCTILGEPQDDIRPAGEAMNEETGCAEPVVDTETCPVQEKQDIGRAMDLVMKIQDRVKNPELFERVIEKMADFQKHGSADQVKEDVFLLLKNYPELRMEMSGCLAEGMESESEIRRQQKHNEMLFECEDDMFRRDLLFHQILFAKDRLEKLVKENQNADPTEEIDVSNYLSRLDFKCINRVTRGSMQNRCICKEMAIATVSRLSRKIRESVACRDDKFQNLNVLDDHQKEVEIPGWDWHSQL